MKTRRRTWICSLLATSLLVGVLLVDGPRDEARSDLPVSPATGDVAKPSNGVKASPMKATPAMYVAKDDAGTDMEKQATGNGATKPGPGANPDEKPAEGRPALEAQPPGSAETGAETGK